MSMQPTTNAAGQQVLNPLALPTPATVTAPDAGSLLNPIYQNAQQAQLNQTDALTRALGAQQDASNAHMSQLAGTLGAPSQALAQASAMPNASITNAQTRGASLANDQQSMLSNSQAVQTAGLQGHLQALAQAASLQRQLSDAAAQGRAFSQDTQLQNAALTQQKDDAQTAIALANYAKSEEMVQYEAERVAAEAATAKATGQMTQYQADQLGMDAQKLQDSENTAQQTAFGNAMTTFNTATQQGAAPHGTGLYAQVLNQIGAVWGPDVAAQIASANGLKPDGTPLGGTKLPAAPQPSGGVLGNVHTAPITKNGKINVPPAPKNAVGRALGDVANAPLNAINGIKGLF